MADFVDDTAWLFVFLAGFSLSCLVLVPSLLNILERGPNHE